MGCLPATIPTDVINDLSEPLPTVVQSLPEDEIIYSINQVQERIASLGPVEEEDSEEEEDEMELYQQEELFPTNYKASRKKSKLSTFPRGGNGKYQNVQETLL